MKRIFTAIFTLATTIVALAQNPASTVLSTNFDAAFATSSNPTGWVSANVIQAFSGLPPIVTPNNPGYGGSISSVKIVTTQFQSPDSNSIPNKSGILLTGTINIATQKLKQGIPYTSKPEGMAYYTKYSPAGIDTAFTIVALTKWNGTSRDTIGFATDIITSNIISWSKRIVPIIYDATLTAAPDTLIILFSSSSRVAPKLGSTFILDEINLYPTGTSNIIETASDNLVVYPNPVSSVLNLKNIDSNISNIKIFDVSGRKVFENKISTFTSTLHLSALSNGLYYLIGSDANNNAISKTKFEVLK